VLRLNGAAESKRFVVTRRMIGQEEVMLFEGRSPRPIAIHTLPPSERRTMCWLAQTVGDLTALYGGPARTALADALAKRAARWDSFLRRGYSMTPLELLVNGYMPRPELEPPRTQLVLGHVSPGEQMFSEGSVRLENFRRRTVLVFEPLGFVRYSETFARYMGATVVLAYPDSGGLAPGVMLHHSDVGHVAGLWRPSGAGRSGGGAVLLSLDLYRFRSTAKDQWQTMKEKGTADCLAAVPACLEKVSAPK
jgi:hypothetical protein